MDNVSFNEEAPLVPRVERPARGLAATLVRMKLAGNEFQANLILVVLALIALSMAIFLFVQSQPEAYEPTPAELESLRLMQDASRRQ